MRNTVPSYRRRSGSSQAIVTLSDSVSKQRRDYWLGEHGSRESWQRYNRLIAGWITRERRLPEMDGADDPTIDGLIYEFWPWVEKTDTQSHAITYKIALRLLRSLYGSTQAAEFSPSKLRLLREQMILGDESADPQRIAWSRTYTNKLVRHIRHMFKWAASHEMVPVTVYQTLATVEPLKRGRTDARETEPVGPVPQRLLDGVLPHLNRQVRAIVELQLLTGARPGELIGMRAIDIEMHDGDDVWLYRPQEHKNAYREKVRIIYIGPKAQQVVQPFLIGRPLDAYLFSPAEAEAERRVVKHKARKTPMSYGNKPGTNRADQPSRRAGDKYTTDSYRRAIQRACDMAFPPPSPLVQNDGETAAQWKARLTPEQHAELKAWRKDHRWHPHQLRHNAGTEIRKRFGLEAAQVMLGHSSANITDAVYAERDERKALAIAAEIG